jgi:hypothetical protein
MKKTKTDITKNQEDIIKVEFINTYIGDLGIFYRGGIYNLPYGLYEKFKNDCKEVE